MLFPSKIVRMPLTEDEIELLARQRMLKNVLNLLMDILHEADPQRAERMERRISQFVDEARQRCSEAGSTDAIINCIMEHKQEKEAEIRAEMRELA